VTTGARKAGKAGKLAIFFNLAGKAGISTFELFFGVGLCTTLRYATL